MKLLIILFLLTSCGDSKVKVQDSKHKGKISGETYSYVILQLEFIQQIKQLCQELNVLSDFNTVTDYNKAVAECTFENLSVLDLNALEQFNMEICDNPQTPEEIQICEALDN